MKRLLQRTIFRTQIAALKSDLCSRYNTKISLTDISGRGATFTFLVRDGRGKNLCVAKMRHPRREKISRKVNARLNEYTYLEAEQRFTREYAILKTLAPDHLTPAPLAASATYLLEEYVEGESLFAVVCEREERFAELYFAGLRALKTLHEHAIYHGQPSMKNMLLSGERIKVIDFEHCLNSHRLSQDEMRALDYLRFALDAQKSFPRLHAQVYVRLGQFLQSEADGQCLKIMERLAAQSFLNRNNLAQMLVQKLNGALQGEEDIIDIEASEFPRDLPELLTLSPEIAPRAFVALHKRFPEGMFKVRKNGRTVAYLSIGFQRPEILLRCIAKLPFTLSPRLFRFLLDCKIIGRCEIASVYVASDCRQQGIARRLANFAEAFARDTLGQTKLYLLVRKENIPAYSLYTKQGYRQCGVQKVKNGFKIRMQKILS
ncbi:MAG: N-acetyltransferase [Candidatus Omnitrophota bacterium]